MAESNKLIINVKDFSTSPGPRYVKQGLASGEAYYHEVLNANFYKAYTEKLTLIVNLDGVDGYMSSFLDEAFGNLVYDFGIEIVKKVLSIVSSEEPEWIDMIESDTYVEWEKRRKKNENPTITSSHSSWMRLVNNQIETINS